MRLRSAGRKFPGSCCGAKGLHRTRHPRRKNFGQACPAGEEFQVSVRSFATVCRDQVSTFSRCCDSHVALPAGSFPPFTFSHFVPTVFGRCLIKPASASAPAPSGESAGWALRRVVLIRERPGSWPTISGEAPPLTSRTVTVLRRSLIGTSGRSACFRMLTQNLRISCTGSPATSPGKSQGEAFGTTRRRWQTRAATSAKIGSPRARRCLVVVAGFDQ